MDTQQIFVLQFVLSVVAWVVGREVDVRCAARTKWLPRRHCFGWPFRTHSATSGWCSSSPAWSRKSFQRASPFRPPMATWRQECWRLSLSFCFGRNGLGQSVSSGCSTSWALWISPTRFAMLMSFRDSEPPGNIPTMLVPLLLVTHFMMFVRLVRGPGDGGWYEEPDQFVTKNAA